MRRFVYLYGSPFLIGKNSRSFYEKMITTKGGIFMITLTVLIILLILICIAIMAAIGFVGLAIDIGTAVVIIAIIVGIIKLIRGES